MKKLLNNVRERKRAFFGDYEKKSWSQDGEDLVISSLFKNKMTGFYVDIGAHHPLRFSNTYLFYRRGWSGINVDAMPGSMELFNALRPRDINLELGVGEVAGELDYYMFNEPALNSFSREVAENRSQHINSYHIRQVQKVKVQTLEQILDEHLDHSVINFLSIDVEGLDLQVLRSNNWEKYRPMRIIIEDLNRSDFIDGCSEIHRFLHSLGYVSEVVMNRNVVYKDSTVVTKKS